jgi:hypothetical protein
MNRTKRGRSFGQVPPEVFGGREWNIGDPETQKMWLRSREVRARSGRRDMGDGSKHIKRDMGGNKQTIKR